MGILTKILGDPNAKEIAKLQPKVDKINTLESMLDAKDDSELKHLMAAVKERLNKGETLDDVLADVFAVVREASKRTIGLRHYDVQLVGGMVLHSGKIAEMKTGEGKTLVASLPLALNALSGKGAQLVTVNDYLARRDAGWMAPIYYLIGLSTGVIIHDKSFIYDPTYSDPEATDKRLEHLKPVTRKQAYEADITYGTNNEFGFDYLRDNMVQTREQMVQRELNFAIVDEVDSILIDEARTPLIISAPADESTDKYYQFASLVRNLVKDEDYVVDEKLRTATLTENGITKMEGLLGVENIYVEAGISTVHHIEQALRAEALFKLDKDYVVKDGEIIIIDEFTGRLMPGRRWSDGLHQAIEAKENTKIQRESVTLATISFQNLFRLYDKLAGMTGTAATEAEEFHKIYNLDVSVIPTNRENVRKDLNDRIYKSEEGKFKAVVAEIEERHEAGQPVLVGTISVERNELLSEMLSREGVPFEVLNAKNHEREALIIANAGKRGAVTIATNIAGRGVDILLGGADATTDVQEEIRQLGGLHVIGTERHESRRIDNQLRGRSGRQGDPGSTQFYVSLEDDLMRIFGGDRVKRLMETFKIAEDQPIENAIISKSLESAQKRVEGANFDSRKHLVEYDDVMNRHRQHVYAERRKILDRADLKESILAKIESYVHDIVEQSTADSPENWNLTDIVKSANAIMPFSESELSEKWKALGRDEIKHEILAKIKEEYERREKEIGEEAARALERVVYLRIIDRLWIEHLDAMEHLREGIGLRGYAQKDPLVEYKHESHSMFENLLRVIDDEIVTTIMKVTVTIEQARQLEGLTEGPRTMEEGRGEMMPAVSASPIAQEAVNTSAKNETVVLTNEFRDIGRNDPCPCGSGLKYKRCGLINAPEHRKS